MSNTSNTSSSLSPTLLKLVIVFLLIAWIITLFLWHHSHQPCVCRGVVVKHPTPTHAIQNIPLRGTVKVPLIQSPGPYASLDSVLQYLRQKGTSVSGRPFTSEIFQSLSMSWLWNWDNSQSPPVGTFASSSGNYYLIYDSAQHQWTLTTTK